MWLLACLWHVRIVDVLLYSLAISCLNTTSLCCHFSHVMHFLYILSSSPCLLGDCPLKSCMLCLVDAVTGQLLYKEEI